ncbi:hypothetical protein SOCEGT47_010370 [Sorangium cellulosum]|uniref:DUF4435 domain-containing protein n=1 Tax=Sorangium cellulosum TaxID=56 RepID=A0A4P2PUX7_SORCE|nr:DUF3226 domain-containing protein [Sorangium cellulosum]AUX20565.1 hypothetical protein SOCEGT47_010370 [Sorangium cellulosum]
MGRRLLLVEGKSDEHVMYALCKRHGVPEKFRIKPAESVEGLLDLLQIEPRASDMERLAAIVDADQDVGARWAAARARLLRAGYRDVPAAPAPGGTFLVDAEARLPNLGLWLMPDNRLPGMLEDFLSFLVPRGDGCLPLVDDFLASIPSESRRFAEIQHAKARIHAWLAVQEEPGKPLGQAITARYLDTETIAASEFLAWLRKALVE